MATTHKHKPTQRCVAVLDVLGFRSFLRDGKVEQLAHQLDVLYQHASSSTVHWSYWSTEEDKNYSSKETVRRLLFSDSLFLWTDPMPANAMRRRAKISTFGLIVANILGTALVRGLPMRAGLAFGEVIIDVRKQIVIGQPIVDAYSIESIQEWAGGALHESFPFEPTAAICNYPVPLKAATADSSVRAVDWVSPFYAGTRRDANDHIEIIRKFLEAQIEISDIDSVRTKYLNTLDFLNSRRQVYENGFFD